MRILAFVVGIRHKKDEKRKGTTRAQILRAVVPGQILLAVFLMDCGSASLHWTW